MSDPEAPATSPGGPSILVVLVTVPDPETGEGLVRQVVEEGLAACGNLLSGLTSIYAWKGEVHRDPESLIIFKTSRKAMMALKDRVVELHPYEVPEFLVIPVTDGHLPYLRWVQTQVGGPEEP